MNEYDGVRKPAVVLLCKEGAFSTSSKAVVAACAHIVSKKSETNECVTGDSKKGNTKTTFVEPVAMIVRSEEEPGRNGEVITRYKVSADL